MQSEEQNQWEHSQKRNWNPIHTPVMTREVLDGLQVRPRGLYIDCNLGEGGHSLAILNETGQMIRLLGTDLDQMALEVAKGRLKAFRDQTILIQGNFADLFVLAKEHGFLPADGILFDLGLSSLQLETTDRGFSFQRDSRLDMRFDQSQMGTAHHVVNERPERFLAEIIFKLGGDPRSRRIARSIVSNRPIESTKQLASIVVNATGWSSASRTHPATRTFQAIRMVVNSELDNLKRGLKGAIGTLGNGGRLVVISYHSLEDKLVKDTFRRESRDCICSPKIPECICSHKATIREVNRRVVKPGLTEVKANPRSRSARLRVAERV